MHIVPHPVKLHTYIIDYVHFEAGNSRSLKIELTGSLKSVLQQERALRQLIERISSCSVLE